MKLTSTLCKSILFLLLAVVPVMSQTTSVTATVVDSNSQAWASGTWQIQFVPTPGMPGPWYYNGVVLTSAQKLQQGSLDGSGNFAATVISTSSITPAGSSWAFTFCPNATSPCGTLTTPINGTSLNISSAVTAAIPPVSVAAPLVPRAYTDAEVSNPPPNQGGLYYNTTFGQPKYWTGATWNYFAGGGTLTSVGLAAPSEFTVTGSPVTGAGGTLTFSWVNPVSIAHGGTNATSPAAAMTNLLPPYVSGYFLTNNGTTLSWANPLAGVYYQTVSSNSTPYPQEPTLNFASQYALTTTGSQTNVAPAPSGVTAGSYTQTCATVDTYGRVTAMSTCGPSQTQVLIITSGICTTGTSASATCSDSPVSWPIAFADSNYAVTCTPAQPSLGLQANIYAAYTASTVTITLQNGQGSAAVATTVPKVTCIGIHP
jgi:hypothetical protein